MSRFARVRKLARLAALLLIVAPVVSCSRRSETLLLITVAGLRADSVAAGQTPAIAALGARGVVLQDLYTPTPDPVGAASSLMTGASLEELRFRWGDLARLPAERSPLAEQLQRAGFVSAAFVGQRDISAFTGLGRGFSTWAAPETPALLRAIMPDELARLTRHPLSAATLVDQAALWLSRHSKDPRVFLWVHFGDVPASVSESADPRSAYQAAVRDVDAAVKSLTEALGRERSGSRIVVGVVSLYGLSLGEGGETLAGLTLADGVVRVPGVIAGGTPGAQPSAPVSLAQFHSLLLTALGRPPGAPEHSDNTVVVSTYLPSREYGWPALARAGGPQGWLRLDPSPRWIPAGGSGERGGEEAWRAAPAALRERLESAGLKTTVGAAPEMPKVLRLMGEAKRAMEARDIALVLRQLEEAAAAAPNAMAPRTALLRALRSAPKEEQERGQSQAGEVLAALRRLAGDDPARRIDLARELAADGRKDDSLAIFRSLTARELSPGERLAVVFGFAAAGANDEAISLVERLIAETPRAPELHELAGDLLTVEGNAFRAREAYEKALDCGGGPSPELLAKLGDVLGKLGEQDAALARYGEAVRTDPLYRYPHSRAADILVSKGQYAAAADAVVKSVPPTGNPADDAFARFEALFGHRLLRAAAQVLDEGLKQRPDDERLILALIHVFVEAGDTAHARQRLASFLQGHPDNPYALVELARLEAVEGRADQAIEALRKAEPRADVGLAERVRTDVLLQKTGGESPLARAAKLFAGAESKRPGSEAARP